MKQGKSPSKIIIYGINVLKLPYIKRLLIYLENKGIRDL